MNNGRKRKHDVDVHDIVEDILATPSAITQLEDLSDTHPSYAALATFVAPFKQYDVASRLKIGSVCAGGSYADVYNAEMLYDAGMQWKIDVSARRKAKMRMTEQNRAILLKKVAVKRFRIFPHKDEDFAKTFAREMRIWISLRHPHVVRSLGFTVVNDFPSLVSEWMENGTLREYMDLWPDFNPKKMAKGIASGLAYIHASGVVHSDLKSDNILIHRDGRPMLSDFGISRLVVESMTLTGTSSLKGNIRWMAIELIDISQMPASAVSNHRFQTKASDVWAYGMVVYELLTRKVPYHNRSEVQAMLAIVRDEKPERPQAEGSHNLSVEELWPICSSCWKKDPNERPKMVELCTQLEAIDPSSPSVQFNSRASGALDMPVELDPELERVLDSPVGVLHVLVHDDIVCCTRFSADGKYLATACNGTAQIYETETGSKICVLNEVSTNAEGGLHIRRVSFSPDGKCLATAAEDKLIRIWEIATRSITRVFQGHHQEIYSLDFSQDGQLLASGSADATTRIWNIKTNTCLILATACPTGACAPCIYSVAFSPDSKLVAAGYLDDVVRIWDVNTGHLVEQLKGHRDIVYSVAFAPDGIGLISGSFDTTVKLWDLTGLLRNLDRNKNSPERERLNMWTRYGCSSEQGSVCQLNYVGHYNDVLCVAVSHDGQWVVSGSEDHSVRCWDQRTGTEHTDAVISVDLSPVGGVLATGSADGQARLWRYTLV